MIHTHHNVGLERGYLGVVWREERSNCLNKTTQSVDTGQL